MIWSSFLVTLNTVAALVVIWGVLCSLNKMTFRTNVGLRVAYVLIGSGAGATLLAPGYLDRTPTAAELCTIIGVALLIMSSRVRIRRLTRRHP